MFVNAILEHLVAILTDGEWSSDWLTHMPADVALWAERIGRALCVALMIE